MTPALIAGPLDYGWANGAPVVESNPADNGGERVDRTMAYVGTRDMFERAGFDKVADITSIVGGVPRIVMRRTQR